MLTLLQIFFTDCTTASFTITSGHYGHVHHFGILGNLDFLEISQTQTPAYFCFTNNLALKELESGKCVDTITNTNLQLVLTNNCKGPWRYNPDNKNLTGIKGGYCLSPWLYSKRPHEVRFVPGLSPCAKWNRVILNPCKYLVFFSSLYARGKLFHKLPLWI